ncbi:hypothetical protein [Ornithinibacillus contaminans]|uniref:hypothetical protein n=1 Tax=Ornithinibacillus contaminans TaxID=694055 RepID=UPI00191BE624|nr:hypothetical protein [Ornithinibacillus contaminans]
MKTEKGGNFERSGLNIIIFVLSLISLLFSLKLFWNIAIYVDESGSSPSDVYGGDFWLYMAWLRLALLAIITFLSGIKLIKRQNLSIMGTLPVGNYFSTGFFGHLVKMQVKCDMTLEDTKFQIVKQMADSPKVAKKLESPIFSF